jgi:quinone-modifying oxidoreductase subunit QmoC
MGQALNDPKWLPLLFAVPAVIFGAVLAWLGNLTTLPEGRIVFSKFMPIMYIEVIFTLAIALTATLEVVSGLRYWRAMDAQAGRNGHDPRRHVLSTVLEILRHARFRQCNEEPAGTRKTYKSHLHATHLLIFYGFMGLVITTASVGVGIYGFGYLTPWPFWHPVKILGNVSGAAVIIALCVFLWRRIADSTRAGKSTYSDWLFLTILLLTTLTGFFCQWLRLAGLRGAYPMYFVHLLLIFFLLVYIPYSKFAHLVYRTVAMLYAASAAARPRTETAVRPA